MGNTVNLKSADGFEFPVYVAQPGGRPKAAVVVVQEIFGVNSHIRSVADGYADAGYLALAPATFHRVEQGVELGYGDADVSAGFALKTAVDALPAPGVMADLQAAIDYAAKATGGSKVGIVGYCWGGLLTWRAACLLNGLSAAAPLLRWRRDRRRGCRTQPALPGACAFRRPRSMDSTGHGRSLSQGAGPGPGSGARLPRESRLQLRSTQLAR